MLVFDVGGGNGASRFQLREDQMANVMFFIVHQVGALNATLQLATDLKARGHHVTYGGLADSKQIIDDNGFEFHTMFEDFFPFGAIKQFDYYQYSNFAVLGEIIAGYRRKAILESFVDFLIDGGDDEFFKVLETARPDLVILSGVPPVEWLALMCMARGIKCVYFRPDFSVSPGTGSPPPDSGIVPTHVGSLRQTFRRWLAWTRHGLDAAMSYGVLPMRYAILPLTRRLAKKYDIDYFQCETAYTKDFFLPLLELLPVHPDFEFEQTFVPDRYYIGASVYLERHEISFPWERLNVEKRLIYCAMGTYLWLSKASYIRFFNEVLITAEQMPDWQWVLVKGRGVDLQEVRPVPPNVIVVDEAPQLGLLKRARVMITHGGANTVKECVLLGVPMVLFPLAGDHFAVAARAVYHGLGVRGKFTKIRARELKSSILTAATHPYVQTQLRLMQHRFEEMETRKVGAALVETLISEKGRASPRRRDETTAAMVS
jgi:zeaxanthin glucosyltransferase